MYNYAYWWFYQLQIKIYVLLTVNIFFNLGGSLLLENIATVGLAEGKNPLGFQIMRVNACISTYMQTRLLHTSRTNYIATTKTSYMIGCKY